MSPVIWIILALLALVAGIVIGRSSARKIEAVDVADECLRSLPPAFSKAVTSCVETMSDRASETFVLLFTVSQLGKDGDRIDVAAAYVIARVGALSRTLSKLDVASKLFIHTALLEMRERLVDELIEKWLVPQTPGAPTSETTEELRRAVNERVDEFLERAGKLPKR
jgi:hypothetical protein